jgi:DNA-directed RNA polymerase specialized sigma24 family protein
MATTIYAPSLLEDRIVYQTAFGNALKQMEPRDLAAFALWWVDEANPTEIGRLFGISRQAVQGRLNKAFRILRQELSNETGETEPHQLALFR